MDVPALEYTVVRVLREKGLHAATAESCTGGMIAERLTNVPGSSEVFGYGFVTYAEAAKQKLLDVPAETIAQYNVVSGPVAAAMAFGAAKESGAELAVAENCPASRWARSTWLAPTPAPTRAASCG